MSAGRNRPNMEHLRELCEMFEVDPEEIEWPVKSPAGPSPARQHSLRTLQSHHKLTEAYYDLGRYQEEMVLRAEQEPRRFFLERGVTYYDGRANYLFECECVLTNERLIIEDVRGRVQQIPLRDITCSSQDLI
jgi:hypothetical protein